MLGASLLLPLLADASVYSKGFIWKRALDYQEGPSVGTTIGNPNLDSQGNPTWAYGWTTGGALNSADPWIFNAVTPSVWDDTWALTSNGVWARDHTADIPGVNNNFNPPIAKYSMSHDVSLAMQNVSADYLPVVTWMNPTGANASLNIVGSLKVGWAGRLAYDVDVDVVIAAVSASAGSERIIFGQTLENPMPNFNYKKYGGGVVPSVTVPISLLKVTLAPDEKLLISIRGDTGAIDPLAWFSLADNLKFRYNGVYTPPKTAPMSSIVSPSAVPETPSALLLAPGLGGLVWGLRRRQHLAAH
jgi:hypothetical protein